MSSTLYRSCTTEQEGQPRVSQGEHLPASCCSVQPHRYDLTAHKLLLWGINIVALLSFIFTADVFSPCQWELMKPKWQRVCLSTGTGGMLMVLTLSAPWETKVISYRRLETCFCLNCFIYDIAIVLNQLLYLNLCAHIKTLWVGGPAGSEPYLYGGAAVGKSRGWTAAPAATLLPSWQVCVSSLLSPSVFLHSLVCECRDYVCWVSERASVGLGLRIWRGLKCFNRRPLSHRTVPWSLFSSVMSQVDFVGSISLHKNWLDWGEKLVVAVLMWEHTDIMAQAQMRDSSSPGGKLLTCVHCFFFLRRSFIWLKY